MHSIRAGARRLARLEIFFVAAATVLTVLTEKLQLPAVLLAMSFQVIILVAYPGALVNLIPRPRWAIAILLFMLVGTLWISAFPAITVPEVMRTLMGILLYAAIVRACASNENRRVGTHGIALLSMAIAVVFATNLILASAAPFIVDWEGANKLSFVPASLYRFFSLQVSDSVNPNVMAGALVIMVPLAVSVVVFGRLHKHDGKMWITNTWFWASLAVSVVGITMLVLMQSRSALLALFASILVLVGLCWRRLRAPIFLLGVVTCIMFLLTPDVMRFLFNTPRGTETVIGLDQRAQIWSRAFYMILDFPITGIGMGTFAQVGELLYPIGVTTHGIPHAHNLFLQVGVDLGIPGLIAWLGVLSYVVLSAWHAYFYGNTWLRALGAGLLASNVALGVHGLTDAVTWGIVRTAPIVWGLWGLAVVVGRVALAPSSDISDERPQ